MSRPADTTTSPAAQRTGHPRWSWLAAGGVVVIGLVAALTRPTAPTVAGAVDPALLAFPDAVLARVTAWVGPLRVAWVLRMLLEVVVPLVLIGTARGRRLVTTLAGERWSTWRGSAVVVVALALVALPLRWWTGWVHAGAFGMRTSSPLRFAAEWAGSVAVEVVLTATAVAALLWLVRRRPDDWPALGTLLATAGSAVLVLVAPLVVTEVLLAPTPLRDEVLLDELGPVLAAAGVDPAAIEVGAASVRTTRGNAMVTGIAPTRRVVVHDTILDRPPSAVAFVVAHELAHVEHRDVPRALLAGAAGTFALLLALRWLSRRRRWRELAAGPGVTAAAVTGVAVVAQLAAGPLVAWESRRAEAAADARALELTGDPAAAITLHRSFVLDELADPTPPAWVRLLSSHPPPAARIRAAATSDLDGPDAAASP